MLARMAHSPLTLKQQRWADAYLISGNATDAARVAGYSLKCCASQGSDNLQKPNVASYLQAQRNKEAKTALSRRERILAELEKMAFANIERFTRLDDEGRRVIDYSNATAEDLAALTQLKTKTRHIYTPKGEHIGTEHSDQFSMADKYRGLELLGKAEGMFRDNEVTVKVDVADRLLAARQRFASIGDGRGEQRGGDDDDR